jgi:hypothetical protein
MSLHNRSIKVVYYDLTVDLASFEKEEEKAP